MRENHHDIQTPKKELLQVSFSRKGKTINALSKKLNHPQQKSSRKNLSSVFTPITEDEVESNISEESIQKISAISESVDVDQSAISKTSSVSDHSLVSDNDVSLQHLEDSVGTSSVSEVFVSDEDQSGESIQSYIASLNQFILPLSATASSVEMTPTSSQISAEPTVVFVDSVTRDGVTTEEMSSFKLELLEKVLRESMRQVFHSADLDPLYKKLLDASDDMVIKEFCSLHEEAELFSRIERIVLLSFLFGILAVLAGFFLFSDAQGSYYGPTPT